MTSVPASTPESVPAFLEAHLHTVCENFSDGTLTAVLGAGASLFGRRLLENPDQDWEGAPSAPEIAEHLAKVGRVSEPPDAPSDRLLYVAQWVATMAGGPFDLYNELHEIFDRDFPITSLHSFMASISSRLRERNLLREPPLFVTTNYDDTLERAFASRGEEFDLVAYVAPNEVSRWGSFSHRSPDGQLTLISDPTNYTGVDPSVRSVILKVHGYIKRGMRDGTEDSYVITEDDYIDYLGQVDLTRLLPTLVLDRLKTSHLLFLGYSLRDWNLRAILKQLKSGQVRRIPWWSVQMNCPEMERQTWQERGVQMFDMPLEEYFSSLTSYFEKWLSEK